MKSVTLPDFLTDAQIKEVVRIYREGGRAAAICDQVIRPNMAEINRKLGQDNDAMFLAYACEYVCMQSRGAK